MINDLLKWLLRTTFIAIFWVFVFSVTYRGQPLFYYANDALVQNSLVRAIDEQLAEVWDRIRRTAVATFSVEEVKEKA